MKIPNDPFIGTHYIGKEELKAVKKIIKSKSLFRYHGPNLQYKTDEFEKEMAKYLNVKYVLACANGGAAIKLACIGAGIEPGDEVIMSPFTFIASASEILSIGAIPVFSDIDETMNIDYKKIEEKITNKTRAILAIHMQGQPCNMKEINKIAKKNNLIVIEDSAQAFGCTLNNKKVGTFGDVGAFSLQAGKTITCGEGGFLATNNKKIYEIAKMYHDNGGYREGCNYPIWNNGSTFYGENFKITEMQSAIAIEQLKKIDKIINKQYKIYNQLLSKIDLKFYNVRPIIKGANPIYTSFALIFETEDETKKFIKYMNHLGISFNLYCNELINEYDTFKKQQSWSKVNYPYNTYRYYETDLSYSKSLCNRVVFLNLSASLKNRHIKYIIKKLEEYKDE